MSASGGENSNLGVDMSPSGVQNYQLSETGKVALVWVGYCAEKEKWKSTQKKMKNSDIRGRVTWEV